MDSLETIIEDPNSIEIYGIPSLCDNMKEPLLLEDRTTFQRNRALIVVMTPGILCYAQSKHSNMEQRVNI